MKCPDCKDELVRKEEHDTAIPLGFVHVYYCEDGKKYYAWIKPYEGMNTNE